MKKILAALLVLTLLGGVVPAYAATVPENYPEVRIDPATGKPYDLGGQTIYIMDYWSGDGSREEEPTEEQQAMYDYQDWLMETYNCTIVQQQGGDWSTCAEEMINFWSEPDGSLRAYIIEPGKTGTLAGNGIAADWSRSTTVDVEDEHWNQSTVNVNSVGNSVYGVSAGAGEPRGCVFFNKRLLEEAGIDWNELYDMQAAGTWTWEAMEEMLEKTTQDTDNDGIVDKWGISGSGDDMYKLATFSNGGSFFEFNEEGIINPNMGSEETREALQWGQELQDKYWMHTPADGNWDWYKQAWKDGQFAFYVYQAYGGFNDHSEMADMEDEWGCVAFPVPNEGDNYVTITSNNTTMIPNVYTDEEISQISLIYELWTQPTPGYEDAWIGNKYNYTDERAVEETYAMLRDPEHQVADSTGWLGTPNDVLGSSLLWSLPGNELDSLLEAGMPAWQYLCDIKNNNLKGSYEVSIDLSGYTTIDLPADVKVIEEEAMYGHAGQVVVIPDGCTAIGSNAFAGAPNLKYVVIPGSVTSISSNAFSGAPSNMRILVYRNTAAAEWCLDYGKDFLYMARENAGYATKVWTLDFEE